MVESTDSRKCDDLSSSRRFNVARGRRVGGKRHMRSVVVVIGHVGSNEAEQMTLAEDDDLIKQFST